MKHFPTLLLLLAALPAHAGELTDYGWAFPLTTDDTSSAWQLELPPQVHEVLARDDLADFEIFDANGKPLPVARYEPPAQPPRERTVQLPVFPLPRRAEAQPVGAHLRVERAPDGSVERIDAGVARTANGPQITDYLLDASRIEDPLDALELAWSAKGDVRTRFAVEASDDLEHWRTVVSAAAVVDLRQDGEHVEQRRIPLPLAKARYLLLRALDGADLGTLEATGRITADEPEPLLWVEAQLREQKDGTFTYEIDGHYDVANVRVEPQREDKLARIEVRSNEDGGTWLARGQLTLVRVRHGDTHITQNEADVSAGPRARKWQLATEPKLATPPRLFLGTRPDRFAFIAEGIAPFVLAAGSANASRTVAPVATALAQIAKREGPQWQPPLARIGERRTVSGEAALTKETPLPWTTILLWSILVGGAALVAALALRLVRSGKAA